MQAQKGLICVKADYDYFNSTTVTVRNTGFNPLVAYFHVFAQLSLKSKLFMPSRTTSFYDSIFGLATAVNVNEPNKLTVTLYVSTPNGLVPSQGKYDIWATDYNNYSLVYSCTQISSNQKIEFAWLLSRTRSMPDWVKTMLKNKLAEAKVDVSKFIVTEQSDYKCTN